MCVCVCVWRDNTDGVCVVVDVLAQIAGAIQNGNGSEEDLVAALEAAGVLDTVTDKALGHMGGASSSAGGGTGGGGGKRSPLDSSTEPVLRVRVGSGSAFLEHIGEEGSGEGGVLRVEASFNGTRQASGWVEACVEPMFDATFVLPLPCGEVDELVEESEKVHVLVVRGGERGGGEKEVVGTAEIEWRKVLEEGFFREQVELANVGEASAVTPGLLDAEVLMLPTLRAGKRVEGTFLAGLLKEERVASARADKAFLVYAKAWWREYLALRDSHRHRVVKVLGVSECGVSRPVVTYVAPLFLGRLLPSPRAAARFVALLHHRDGLRIGGEVSEVWHSVHSILAQGGGASHDLALILACLFLGFGMNAYVAVGTSPVGANTWVVTLDAPASGGGVLFWDPLSGEAHSDLSSPESRSLFSTIATLFNDRELYANAQVSDKVEETRFDLGNAKSWFAMDPDILSPLTHAPPTALLPPTLSPISQAIKVENALVARVEAYRLDLGLSTQWSDVLSHLLTPALDAYEMERRTGVVVPGNAEFQQAVRAHVPKGWVFKAFPIQFKSTSAAPIWDSLLASPIALSILHTSCASKAPSFAVRCLISLYPDNVVACWLMLAVTHER